MDSKNKHFRHILVIYFYKGKKVAEAHKEIRECDMSGRLS